MSDVEYNGYWYTVTDHQGDIWTFDPDELNVDYIEQNLWAWSRLLDFVNARENA